MDRDSFIIAVFLLGCEKYSVIKQQYQLRRGGFGPALTYNESPWISAASSSNSNAARIYLHAFTRIVGTFFRNWPIFVRLRKAANLWQIKAAIQQRLTNDRWQAK